MRETTDITDITDWDFALTAHDGLPARIVLLEAE